MGTSNECSVRGLLTKHKIHSSALIFLTWEGERLYGQQLRTQSSESVLTSPCSMKDWATSEHSTQLTLQRPDAKLSLYFGEQPSAFYSTCSPPLTASWKLHIKHLNVQITTASRSCEGLKHSWGNQAMAGWFWDPVYIISIELLRGG